MQFALSTHSTCRTRPGKSNIDVRSTRHHNLVIHNHRAIRATRKNLTAVFTAENSFHRSSAPSVSSWPVPPPVLAAAAEVAAAPLAVEEERKQTLAAPGVPVAALASGGATGVLSATAALSAGCGEPFARAAWVVSRQSALVKRPSKQPLRVPREALSKPMFRPSQPSSDRSPSSRPRFHSRSCTLHTSPHHSARCPPALPVSPFDVTSRFAVFSCEFEEICALIRAASPASSAFFAHPAASTTPSANIKTADLRPILNPRVPFRSAREIKKRNQFPP